MWRILSKQPVRLLNARISDEGLIHMTINRGASIFAVAARKLFASPAFAADVLYVKAAHLIVDPSQPAISPGALVITDGSSRLPAPRRGARRRAAARSRPLTVMPSLARRSHASGRRRAAAAAGPADAARDAGLRGARRAASVASALCSACRDACARHDRLPRRRDQERDRRWADSRSAHRSGRASAVDHRGARRFLRRSRTPGSARSVHAALRLRRSPADAEKAVQLQIKFGARVIKLMASGRRRVAARLARPTRI